MKTRIVRHIFVCACDVLWTSKRRVYTEIDRWAKAYDITVARLVGLTADGRIA